VLQREAITGVIVASEYKRRIPAPRYPAIPPGFTVKSSFCWEGWKSEHLSLPGGSAKGCEAVGMGRASLPVSFTGRRISRKPSMT